VTDNPFLGVKLVFAKFSIERRAGSITHRLRQSSALIPLAAAGQRHISDSTIYDLTLNF
jgi:hypothetical protein